ncbi:MAG: hypothetical protein QXU82_01910 [Candidatus Aenigmatarchaeota archaeon]
MNIINMLIGAALLIIGLWLLLPPIGYPYQGIAWDNFKFVAMGLIPVIVTLVGFLMVWVEFEERKEGVAKRKK